MRRVWRHIRGILETDAVESFVIRFEVAWVLFAAAARKHHFHLLPESLRVGDVVRVDDPTAEQADVGKFVEILQRDNFVSAPPMDRPAIARCG